MRAGRPGGAERITCIPFVLVKMGAPTRIPQATHSKIRSKSRLVSFSDACVILRCVWLAELKFNKYCGIFVLFDKKFLILN
jgi:hypothetical protein